jgi:hypothetical protein
MVENTNVWYIIVVSPNKLVGALIAKVEWNIFLIVISTPPKTNSPIGLGTMSQSMDGVPIYFQPPFEITMYPKGLSHFIFARPSHLNMLKLMTHSYWKFDFIYR